MLNNDKTYLSLVIMGVWLIVSGAVGYYTWKRIEKPEFLWFAGELYDSWHDWYGSWIYSNA